MRWAAWLFDYHDSFNVRLVQCLLLTTICCAAAIIMAFAERVVDNIIVRSGLAKVAK